MYSCTYAISTRCFAVLYWNCKCNNVPIQEVQDSVAVLCTVNVNVIMYLYNK